MIRGSPKQSKQRRKGARKQVPFQRVSAEIQIDSSKKIAASRVFLNDLNPTGMGCFCSISIAKGELVTIVLEQPKHLYVKGTVMWCTPYNMDSKVLSTESFKFRMGIRFNFEDDEEKNALQKFCDELYTDEP